MHAQSSPSSHDDAVNQSYVGQFAARNAQVQCVLGIKKGANLFMLPRLSL
jgi:hypothetical protein